VTFIARGRGAARLGAVRLVALLLLTASGAVAAGCTPASEEVAVVRQAADPNGYRGSSLPSSYALPDVTLQDTAGQSFNLQKTPSKPVTLLFFGYTNCPDVCITVLSDLAMALNRVDPGTSDQIQVLFVTTDPARDTGHAIRRYLDRFDPSFIGLRGDLGTITRVAERLGVAVEGKHRLASGGYDVGHGAQVIGFDKSRTGAVLWTQSTPVGDLMHDMQLLVDRQR
jgi:protein SCO1/2